MPRSLPSEGTQSRGCLSQSRGWESGCTARQWDLPAWEGPCSPVGCPLVLSPGLALGSSSDVLCLHMPFTSRIKGEPGFPMML